MATQRDSLSKKLDRVQKSIQQFPEIASRLNDATDQLGKSIVQLEGVLKKFSLGIPTWVAFNNSASADGMNYYHEDLGYAKIGGKWGIAVRTVQGDERSDHENVDQWPFGEAPRHLRVLATEVIPELLEELLKGAAEMSKKMADRAEEIDALTSGINSVGGPNFIQNPHPKGIGLKTLQSAAPNFLQEPQRLPSPRNLFIDPNPASGKARK